MVWGCFWGRNRGTLTPLVVKSIDKHVYVKMLDYLLLPVIARVQNTIGSPVFQQDNAPIVQAFFDHITVEDWPAISSDLSPIKHVWVEPKCQLHMKYPVIKNIRGGPNKVRERLAEVLPEIWAEEFFEKLWKSVPDR
jgi:hypothetical protein